MKNYEVEVNRSTISWFLDENKNKWKGLQIFL